MCDADVDGSHIRTLILTFFFRQMLEVIQRGHLYIAQPPLYKVAEGRRETYLKDDDEYHAFLVKRIQDVWQVEMGINGESRTFKGARLAQFLDNVASFRADLDKLSSRGYPADALRVALVYGLVDRRALNDQELIETVAGIIEASGFHSVNIEPDEEHGGRAVTFVSRRDGVERPVRLDWNLLSTAEYRSMARNKLGREALTSDRFVLTKGEEVSEVDNLEEMLETLFGGARKGLSIQRYKGLGEMNSEQLWETTMDPERRRLLRVEIGDDVGADQMFTVLMGDQVPPRREFIEKNALNVTNLDI